MELNEYNFSIDHKITAYERLNYVVRAATYEEAVKKIQEEAKNRSLPSIESSECSDDETVIWSSSDPIDVDVIDDYYDADGNTIRAIVDDEGNDIPLK